jgi:hypothetical protein
MSNSGESEILVMYERKERKGEEEGRVRRTSRVS